jgi:hypothetical protein
MGTLSDREFNLDGWGADKRLVEGPCGHCHYAVAFKEPETRACLEFRQTLDRGDDEDEQRTHYFVMGICPRPRCQQATIVYRAESVTVSRGDYNDPVLLEERVVFPSSSLRAPLPENVPSHLRRLYQEAGSIENLSPNGAAFLAGRILEQTLRERFQKPRGKLAKLIDEFLKDEDAPQGLHQLMHDIREFRNIAGHPAQANEGDWTAVDAVEATYTLDVVAELLEYIYVKPVVRKAMRERWQAKKRGESPPPHQTETKVVVGGRDAPPAEPHPSDDEVPF